MTASHAGVRLLCVPGPTGAGKTAAAITLARELGGEVVNFDSRQVYTDFPVITAQPSAEERAACPHLLYGFLGIHEKISAASYAALALDTIDEVRGRGKLPILVGGTGMYLNAVLRPLADIPEIPADVRSRVQQQCDELGPNALHARLAELDPTLAKRLHPNDRQRIMRGVEVFEATGKPLSVYQKQTRPDRGFNVLQLGVGMDLPDLTPFLLKRIELMLEAGALEEARAAMAVSDDASAPGWTGIGCAELLAHLRGDIDMDECKRLWGKNTRAYAKRQLTWFRADKSIRWYLPGKHARMLDVATAFLAQD